MLKKMLKKIAGYIPIYRELLQIRDTLSQIKNTLVDVRAMEAIRCYDLELEHHPRYAESRRLHRFAFQVNSEDGEDGIINEIFRRIGTSNRVFAEIGVGDGIENNTAFLLSQGWKGFWIDGNDAFLQTINEHKALQDGCLVPSVSFVEKENIVALFEQIGIPKDFDLLSIDIDQNTFYIWEALHKYLPRVVVVEYNSAIPPDIDWKVQYVAKSTWDGTQNFGASLKAFEKLGIQLGYSLVGCDFNGVNAFFIRNDLVANKFADPFTAENHYEPPRYQFYHRRGHRRTILDRQQTG
jgi:hypothetical protein